MLLPAGDSGRQAVLLADSREAATDLFPLRFRAGAGHQDREPIESDPAHVSLRRLETHVDTLVCWHLPAASPMAARLAARYRLLAAGDEFRVYATARAGGPPPARPTTVPPP